MNKKKIECPKCNEEPTGKYRDEMRIDGMYCRPCNVAWNVDWANEKQLYETAVEIDSDEEQIEQILMEANAYNLRNEVKTTAEMFIKDDPDLNKACAYDMAYMQWINPVEKN